MSSYGSKSQIVKDLSALDRAFPLGLSQQPKLRPGERRPVAVLFFDLRGIDSLENDLSLEEPMQLRNGILRLLGRLVEAYGGYVDKYSGGRVMALFGARLAGENDAMRTAETALRMMETMEEVCDSFGLSIEQLQPVAGIAFGEVTVAPDPSGHLTATGTPVNLASRLEGLAEPGQVLAGPDIHSHCRNAVRWDDMGQMPIKGLSEETRVYSLRELAGANTGWNPVRLSRREAPFVGRLGALDDLDELVRARLADAAAPNLLLLLEGEAGLGKSRLARELLGRMSEQRAPTGHARPYAQPPFWMWTTMLQHLLGQRLESRPDISDLRAFLEEVGADNDPFTEPEIQALGYLLSLGETDSLEQLGDKLRRERIRFALMKLVSALAADGRRLLLLEDLHWVDAASLEMLSMVMEADYGQGAIVVISTAREVPSGLPESGVDIRRHTLEPLAPETCLELASGVLRPEQEGRAPEQSSPLGSLIQRYCGGNPLFIEELSTIISETGLVAEEDGELQVVGDLAAIRIPTTLSALVRARLDKLPRFLRNASQVSAVIGDDLDRSLAASVLERLGEHETATGSIDRLIELGILVGTGGGAIAFRHGMVQAAAYDSILHSNRRLLHRLVAEEAEASLINPQPEVAAAHWYAAGEITKALPRQIDALRRATLTADRAVQKSMLATTYKWLEEYPDTPDRLRHLLKIMRQELAILQDEGGSDQAESLAYRMLETARKTGDPELTAGALVDLAQYLNNFKNADLDKAKALLEESLEIARRIDSKRIQAGALAGLANIYADIGDIERSYQYNLEAAELRVSLGLMDKAAITYTNLASNLDHMGRVEEAVEYYNKALEIQAQIGNIRALGYIYNGLAIAHAMDKNLDRAEESFIKALASHRRIGNRTEEGAVLGNLGTLYKAKGQPKLSLEYRQQALQICRETNNRRSEAILLENIGNTAREMGDLDKAEEPLRKALELCTELGLQSHLATTLSMLGLLALDRRQKKEAAAKYTEALPIIADTGMAAKVFPEFSKLRERLLDQGAAPKELPLPKAWSEG